MALIKSINNTRCSNDNAIKFLVPVNAVNTIKYERDTHNPRHDSNQLVRD